MNIEEKAQEGEIGKTLGILTNPLESSFESSRTITIAAPVETRIYTGCSFKEPTYIGAGPVNIPIVTSLGFVSPNNEMLLVVLLIC